MATFAHLLAQHAATTLARQHAFAQLVGPRACHLDVAGGCVAFGEDLRFPVQVLGRHRVQRPVDVATDAPATGTVAPATGAAPPADGGVARPGDAAPGHWLWAWADTANGLGARLLADAFALRNQGEANGLRELSARGAALDEPALHALATVCRGLTDAVVWHRVPCEDGTMLVLLRGLPPRITARVPDARIRPVLMQALATFAIDPRQAAMYFLSQQGFGLEETASGVIARRGSDSRFTLTFGDDGRLLRLVDPAQAARARPWWRPW